MCSSSFQEYKRKAHISKQKHVTAARRPNMMDRSRRKENWESGGEVGSLRFDGHEDRMWTEHAKHKQKIQHDNQNAIYFYISCK